MRTRDAGFQYVGISLDGLAEQHNRFRRDDEAFRKALEGLRNCVEAGLKAGIRFTVTKDNLADLDGVLANGEGEIPQVGIIPLMEGADPIREPAEAEMWFERGVRLVGVDYLSVAPFDDAVAPHQILLGAGVVAVGGLALDGIAPGTYWLVCLPLKITGGEGAPARAILMDSSP